MTLLAVGGVLLLGIALVLREIQLARERSMQAAVLNRLQTDLHSTRKQLRRTWEDLFVLRNTLQDRHLVSDTDMVRNRLKLIEAPRRVAQQRERILLNNPAPPHHLILDENETFH